MSQIPPVAGFDGRVGRLPFAVSITVLTGLMSVAVALAFVCLSRLGIAVPEVSSHIASNVSLPYWSVILILAIDCCAILTLFVLLLSFSVRRLHDANLSGYLVFAFPLLAAVPFPNSPYLPSTAALIWIALLIALPSQAAGRRFDVEA